ncbi:ketoacyl-ACP synthase III [Sporolactobacillus sp. THM7-7]|nr:ketoacyl-ACP synthase III [Sporolactobacillus sp. THM7-7]
MISKAKITAVGGYVPDRRLTNSDLEKLVETSDEWIVRRTGIKERRILPDDQFTSDLAFGAVRHMLNQYNVSLEDVDLVIVATTTPDYGFPSVAALLQARFHMERAGAFDLNAACAGFEYALHVANALVTSGWHRKILVVAADAMSKVTDYTDRTTCILFGDGAGAALVEYSEEPGFIGAFMGADGNMGKALYRTGISTVMNREALIASGKVVQNGREVFKWAVKNVVGGVSDLLDQNGLDLSDIDWFVPHSANLRMIESICERIHFPMNKVLYSMVYYGNTSSASIPLAIHDGLKEGKLKKGDLLLLYGFGGGLVHCGQLIKCSF